MFLIISNSYEEHEDASETKMSYVTTPISLAVKDIGQVSNNVAERVEVDGYKLRFERRCGFK